MSDLSLEQAVKLIRKATPLLDSACILLSESGGKICAEDVYAKAPIPHFRQSAMDGFALSKNDCTTSNTLNICGEIAAGCIDIISLKKSSAIRIMTGGRVPDDCDQVIPFELCDEANGAITIREVPKRSHIRKIGTDVGLNQLIISAGEPITPGHMHLAATATITHIQIFNTPKIGVLCTGSELVDHDPKPGQIISGNRFLLTGLAKLAGAEIVNVCTVQDDVASIRKQLKIMARDADIIITTGGVGPGKYDLVNQAFAQNEISLFYSNVNVRPGKTTLFGRRDGTLFFALPGPPPAVRLLFHELALPAIFASQNNHTQAPRAIKGHLSEELAIKQAGILNLKGGMVFIEDGICIVRPAKRHEAANCIILVPPHRKTLKKDELVTIHLTEW
jgi:molybdopterin molybdotransferase